MYGNRTESGGKSIANLAINKKGKRREKKYIKAGNYGKGSEHL